MKKNYAFVVLITILFGLNSHFSIAQGPAQDGQWSPPIQFGIVPVAVANLPDGRLITWSSKFRDTYTEIDDGMTYTEIFDPTIGTHGQALGETVTQTNHDMFCPGINTLPDGRILSAGGTSSERTSIYDPVTEVWTRGHDMNINRGYQGNVTLSDGSVFTVGGSWSGSNLGSTNGGKDAELWSPETGWFTLPGIKGEDIYTANDLSKELQGLYRVDNHVWLWAAPNGKIFHAGPGEMMNWIDVANGGSITNVGLRGNDTYSMKGNTVMFDVGKILKTGGAESYGDTDPVLVPAKNNAFVIDFNNENNVTVTSAGTLAFSRTMHNSTVLPDGKILVTGGLDKAEVFSDTGARLTCELYDPVANTWTQVPGMTVPRTYHSVAILMTDGRVFVGGGGLCDYTNTDECVNHMDAEIYSPAYLFDSSGQLATRPTISAPATADYNSNITVTGSTGIQEFSLVRFSAATHSTNNEQRRIPVTFTGNAGNYSVAIPDRNLLPPGNYMLFAMDSNGVPSVAETVNIGEPIPLNENPNLVMHLQFDETTGSVAQDATTNNNDGTIYFVENNGATKTPSTTNWTAAGLFGGAVQMDGETFQSNTIVDIAHSPSIAATEQSITVMAWVNRDDIDNNVGILTHDYPAMFFGFHNSLFKWEFITDLGGGDCYSGYSPINQWVHIAATYDGTTARLFANGVEVCTQAVSGSILYDDTTPNFSSFASSGFYEPRDPNTNNVLINNNYNQSGVTDEVSGKIDELKIYNTAMGAAEIKALYDLAVGLQGVANCPEGTITAEYKIGSGAWTAGNVINAPEGVPVFIRAITTGTYYVTTAQNNNESPTFESGTDFTQANGYQINPATDIGLNNQLALTTAGGCATVVTYNAIGGCDPGDTPIRVEWSLNGGGSYDSAPDSNPYTLTVAAGTPVLLSILPNGIDFTIEYDGGTLYDGNTDYSLGNVALTQSGDYLFTSSEGCSTLLTLNVTNTVCDASTLKAQWKLNGQYAEAPDELPVTVNVLEGETFEISMVPEGTNFTIVKNSVQLYQGQGDYDLGNIELADAGDYIITTDSGCTTTLTLNVSNVVCDGTTLMAEWSLNNGGSYDSAPDNQPVTVVAQTGDVVRISMLPNGVNFTVTYNGSVVYDNEFDYILGAVTFANSGDYIIRTEQGCETTLTLDVQCPSGPFTPEYTIDGTAGSGEDTITVNIGTPVVLSTVEGNVAFTITPPSGPVSNGDLDLGNITLAQAGQYLFTSAEGCTKTLSIIVGDPCTPVNFTPEYTIDGTSGSGETSITVEEGQPVVLGLVQTGVTYTITDPDATVTNGSLDLGNITLAQAGSYVYNSTDGCTSTLDITVTPTCPADSITPRYTVEGATDSGAASITVDVGNTISLDVVQTGLVYTITRPDNSVNDGALDLGAVTLVMAGDYVFTSEAGCTATLTILVNDPCAAGGFTPEYTVDGTAESGNSSITVEQGTPVSLALVETGITYTITAPDASVSNGALDLGNITLAMAGDYVYSSDTGCEATLTIVVTDGSCDPNTFTPQYTLGGEAANGDTEITVTEGTTVVLGLLEPGTNFTITGPDTTVTTGVLDLGNITTAQAGVYMFASDTGCSAQLTIVVNPDDQTGGIKDIIVYPNPVRDGIVRFVLDDFMNEAINVSFFNIYGRLVIREMIPANHETEVAFDMGLLSDGTYIIEIARTTTDENTIKKVIKLRQ